MRLFSLLFTALSLLVSQLVMAAPTIELTNATLVAKLHFDANPRRGQMVGAYIASIKAPAGTPVSKVTVLLNPGLQFIKAEAGRTRLNATEIMQPVAGSSTLELKMVEIDLGRTLTSSNATGAKGRMDIAIHYRGYIDDISWMDMEGVQETLNPRYSMIRPESFSYPVFAKADKESINEAFNHPAFYQSATIEFPGANTLVSNLNVDAKAINGNATKAELSSNSPSRLLTVAIGPYKRLQKPGLTLDYLNGYEGSAQNTATVFTTDINAISALLGPIGQNVKIIQLQDGFLTKFDRDTLFVSGEFLSSPEISDNMKERLAHKWLINTSGRAEHWAAGLNRVITATAFEKKAIAGRRSALFTTVKQAFSANKKLSKTTLPDYIIEGFGAYSADVSGLGFLVLHTLLGEDDFFALVRRIRAELGTGYADMAALADHLQSNLGNKKAKKFAKNWFSGNKAAKDIMKADSFEALADRYQ